MGGLRDKGDPEISDDSTEVASVVDVVEMIIDIFVGSDDSLVVLESAKVDIVEVLVLEVDEVKVDVVEIAAFEVDVVEVDVVVEDDVEESGCRPVEAQTPPFSVVARVVDVVDVMIIPSARDISEGIVVDETVDVDGLGVVDDFSVGDSGRVLGMNGVTRLLTEVAVANVVEVVKGVDVVVVVVGNVVEVDVVAKNVV